MELHRHVPLLCSTSSSHFRTVLPESSAGWKIYDTDVRYADLLVHNPCILHYRRCPDHPRYQSHLLGIPDHLDIKFDFIYHLLF